MSGATIIEITYAVVLSRKYSSRFECSTKQLRNLLGKKSDFRKMMSHPFGLLYSKRLCLVLGSIRADLQYYFSSSAFSHETHSQVGV